MIFKTIALSILLGSSFFNIFLKGENIDSSKYIQIKQDHFDLKQKKTVQTMSNFDDPIGKTELENNKSKSKSNNPILIIVKNFVFFLCIIILFFSKEVRSINAFQRRWLFLILIVLFVWSSFVMQTNPVEFLNSVVSDSITAGITLLIGRKYHPEMFKYLGVKKPTKWSIALLAIELAVILNMVWYSFIYIFLF